jgi:hypothetical protein
MGYIPHYWFHFAAIRSQVQNVVEIGLQTPSSILMWEEFFPKATIHGIDIDEKCKDFAGGRRKVYIGDQRDARFLRSFIKEVGGNFDVVIDDGEHSEYAILTSFTWLYPALSDHGLYAIEDIVGMERVPRFLRDLERCINYWPADFPTGRWPYLYQLHNAPWVVRNTVAIHFYRHLCIVNRGFNPEDNPYLQKPSS